MRTLLVSNPRSASESRSIPRVMNPAPASSISATATSIVTIAWRNNWRARPPVAPRVVSCRTSCTSGVDEATAGARPKSSPVAIDSSNVNWIASESSSKGAVVGIALAGITEGAI